MADWTPSIAIVGAGAVGGYYGARLAQHGHEVHFLLRSDYPAVARKGWVVRSCDGDFCLPAGAVNVYDNAQAMPPADLVIVAMKATSNDQLEPLIRPLMKDNTLILTLQNGLGNEERLAELFGAGRVFGGLCFVCLNRTEPGVIHHIDYGLIRVGAFLEEQAEQAEPIVRLLSACRIKSELIRSLKYGRWEKLAWNIPFSGLGTVLDLSTDKLLADPAGLELVRRIIAEIVAAARAVGVELPADIAEQKIRQTRTMGAYRSSMQIDRQLGRPMEIEAILGEPVRAAARAGVATPHMEMLYRMARLVGLGDLRELG